MKQETITILKENYDWMINQLAQLQAESRQLQHEVEEMRIELDYLNGEARVRGDM